MNREAAQQNRCRAQRQFPRETLARDPVIGSHGRIWKNKKTERSRPQKKERAPALTGTGLAILSCQILRVPGISKGGSFNQENLRVG